MIATLVLSQYRTPKGATAFMEWREGTADHNNLYSCLTEDEYGLASLSLSLSLGSGIALDIGAHIGGVSIGLALDNPEAKIVAVEALSENVDLLRRNAERNGVADRVSIVHGAAAKPGTKSAEVEWDFDADEAGQHHRYIANAQGMNKAGAKRESVVAYSLDDLPGPIAFAKIDCEGCEYDFLQSKAVASIAEIRGEFHAGFDRIEELLGPTHVVTITGGNESFGAFRAVRR